MPELAVDPCHAGDEAVGLDRAENRAGIGIDLVDLPVAIVPDPERPLGPREPRVAAVARRGNRREHAPGRGIDLLDAILRNLKQVPAIERGAGMRGDVDASAASLPLAGSIAFSVSPAANQTCSPS